MAKVLMIDPDKCTTCRLCELVCSERHGGAFRPSQAHIQIAIDVEGADYFPKVCIQCDDAPCILGCPSEALVRDVRTNAVVVIEERCSDCRLCEAACPYGVIRCWDGIAHKCDLCGGDPECVRFCAAGALRFEDAEQWPSEARKAYADRLESMCEEANT
jgi:Fe-S-cluster-containing hydrogenase component 2